MTARFTVKTRYAKNVLAVIEALAGCKGHEKIGEALF